MIIRALTLIVLMAASIYVSVLQGVRRFAVMGEAPLSVRPDLQFWGMVYLFIGALMFTGTCTLAFYWLAKALQKKS